MKRYIQINLMPLVVIILQGKNKFRSKFIELFFRSRSHPGGFSTITALKPSLQRMSDILLTFYTLFLGIIQPSILNSFYFFTFLFLLTWYALYTRITRRLFNTVKLILIFYTGLHLLILYTYQIQVSKDFFQPDHIVARLFGLTDLARSASCSTWWKFTFNSYWTAYVNYISLWVYFFCTVTQYNWTRTGIHNFGERGEDNASSDHEELLPAVPDIEHGPNSLPLERITSAVLDRQKISVIFRRPGEKETTTTEGLTAITFFFLYHSYVFQLIAMMTWALLYHSVFGLIFLFLACVLWALRNSRKWCFRLSPFLLAYVEILLIAQYIYSLDLIAEKEIPVSSGLEIIGFQQASSRSAAFLSLGVKSILSLPFFVILRLFLRERFYDSLSEHDRRKRLNYGTFSTPTVNREPPIHAQNVHTGTQGTSPIFKAITKFLTKFWLFLVAFVLLVNALSSPPVDYTAGYLVLFCILILLLHISFRFFRNVVFIFWTLLIVYSSIILLAVYTYQFPKIPKLWQDTTKLSADDFAKIGLVDYQDEHNSSLLFVRLLLPILLVLVTMLQLKFFHDPWAKLVQTPSQSRRNSVAGNASEDAKSTWQMLRQIMKDFAEILWRIAEVHLPKLVLLILIITASSHICVLNLVLVLFVSLAVCLPALAGLISLLLTIYLALSTVTRVVYLIHYKNFNSTDIFDDTSACDIRPDLNNGTTITPLSSWVGFEFTNAVFEKDIIGLVIVMVIIAIQLSVRYRQRHIRRLRAQEEPANGLIFPFANPQHFDRSLLDCIMFFFNYGFYKFGLEATMIMMAIVAWTRMDVLGCMIVVWLFIFAFCPRRVIRVLWPLFLFYLAIMLPLQYAMWVGLPEELCLKYPWSDWLIPDPNSTTTILGDNLLKFLDLANYRQPPKYTTSLLVADFFLILFVASQELVFRQERSSHPAGDNYSIYTSGDYALRKNNPTYDFITEQKSFVDYFKIALYYYCNKSFS
jgi:hypothetical protein